MSLGHINVKPMHKGVLYAINLFADVDTLNYCPRFNYAVDYLPLTPIGY